MIKNITNKILMIRPIAFNYNEETASNNYYQKKDYRSAKEIQNRALFEFDRMVETLKENKIDVKVLEDTREPHTPDSIFPNNWFSTHTPNTLILYPMYAENRRLERREDINKYFDDPDGINIIDYSLLEKENIFLEGTGAIVLDRWNKKAYCSLSERANEKLFDIFCDDMGYEKIAFHSYQTVENTRKPIYHTNVMLSIAENYAILCADSIDDLTERANVIKNLEESGKEVVLISEHQVENFLGNALELRNLDGINVTVMSLTAFNSLTIEQLNLIEKYSKIIPVDVETIERYGGGSARCMIAELFI